MHGADIIEIVEKHLATWGPIKYIISISIYIYIAKHRFNSAIESFKSIIYIYIYIYIYTDNIAI